MPHPPRRIAALYDIHGNLPALEAVLAEVEAADVDLVLVGGDVFPGPRAAECLARLLALPYPTVFVRGNGEREVLAARRAESSSLPPAVRADLAWHAAQLSDETARFLGTWPLSRRLTVAQFGSVLCCHATPTSDSDIVTERTPDAAFAAAFRPAGEALVLCGHTHMQFQRSTKRGSVVNAGSVGMPFGHTGADWLLLTEGEAELRHTNYDLEAAVQSLRASGYPSAQQFAEQSVLAPPSAEQMTLLFEKSRGG